MNATDPVKVYEHARDVGDRSLTDALARRLFPWRRESETTAPSPAAWRTLQRLIHYLGLRSG